MQMSELAARSGLSVATIKFYLREGLLPAGEPTSATRATYSGAHVRRLRLIRALVDVGGLRLDSVRAIVAAVDEAATLHDTIGVAHTALAPTGPSSRAARRRVDALVRHRGWRVGADSRNREALAIALDALERLGHDPAPEVLETYADAAAQVADADIARVPTSDPESAVEFAVVGTVLYEPVLLALRRLAHEDRSSRRLARGVRTTRRTPD